MENDRRIGPRRIIGVPISHPDRRQADRRAAVPVASSDESKAETLAEQVKSAESEQAGTNESAAAEAETGVQAETAAEAASPAAGGEASEPARFPNMGAAPPYETAGAQAVRERRSPDRKRRKTDTW